MYPKMLRLSADGYLQIRQVFNLLIVIGYSDSQVEFGVSVLILHV